MKKSPLIASSWRPKLKPLPGELPSVLCIFLNTQSILPAASSQRKMQPFVYFCLSVVAERMIHKSRAAMFVLEEGGGLGGESSCSHRRFAGTFSGITCAEATDKLTQSDGGGGEKSRGPRGRKMTSRRLLPRESSSNTTATSPTNESGLRRFQLLSENLPSLQGHGRCGEEEEAEAKVSGSSSIKTKGILQRVLPV